MPDSVNIDTSAAITFVSEGSPMRGQLRALVQDKELVMAEKAIQEFEAIITAVAGPLERERAQRFLAKVTLLPDNPSPRARGLRPRASKLRTS